MCNVYSITCIVKNKVMERNAQGSLRSYEVGGHRLGKRCRVATLNTEGLILVLVCRAAKQSMSHS